MRTINWNDVPDSSFDVLADGEYIGKIIEVEETMSQKGDEMWRLTIQVKGTKTTVRTNVVFTESILFNIKKLYTAIFGADNLPAQIAASQLANKIVGFTTKQQDYNGKTYANVVLGSWTAPSDADLADDYPTITSKAATTSNSNSSSAIAADEEDPF